MSDWRVAGLLCASEHGHSSIVTQLLECIAKGSPRHKIPSDVEFELVPIYCYRLATADGHVNVIQALQPFGRYYTPSGQCHPYYEVDGGLIALAAFRGQKKIIEVLLNDNRSLLVKDLEVTARWQNERAFSLLLSYTGSDTDLTSSLSSAASANNPKVIELILDTSYVSAGAPTIGPRRDPRSQQGGQSHKQRPYVFLNGIDERSRTALITAAWGDCGAAAKALCQDGRVDLHCCDESGMNALQISVLEGHTDFLKSILERDDLDVNVRGRWEETPLIMAVRKSHAFVVFILLDNKKVDASLRDIGGLTAMDIAVMKDHEPIIYLLSNGHAPSGRPRLFPVLFQLFQRMMDEDRDLASASAALPSGRWFQ